MGATEEGVLTIKRAAAALGVHPQKLRRLEAQRVIPCARRSSLSGERYFLATELPELRRLIDGRRRGASAA